jgi:hypothetical protein
LVSVKVPWASGVQVDVMEIVGGARVGVAVGDWQKVELVAGTVPPPDVSNSSVPNSPAVWIWVDAPAASWNVPVAMGVPFSSRV